MCQKGSRSMTFCKTVAGIAGNFELSVTRCRDTHWKWVAFLLQNNHVIAHKVPIYDDEQEAMKEAHFLHSFHVGLSEEYPEDYMDGWREVEIPLARIIEFPKSPSDESAK